LKKIAVVGSLNMDIVVKVDHMPKVGETIMGHGLAYIPGGKGANQACAAGRLGGNAVMLGKVGGDQFGDALVANLAAAGVETGRIQRSRQPTGTALITVNNQGNNSIVVAPGANSDCDIAYADACRDVWEAADVVMLQMEIPHEAVYHLVREAKKAGKTVILNPAPAVRQFPDALYSDIDYITPNETELEILTGMEVGTPEEIAAAADSLLRKGAGRVLVTCGPMGALLAGRQGWKLYGVADVKVVDTTAAGDTFNAAFAVALTEGRSEAEAVAFANKAATLAVIREGAQISIPSRDDVERFDELVAPHLK